MGYRHIDNLYKNQSILLLKECYALEKIHGTSAHVSWSNGELTFSSGGEKHARFTALFDRAALTDAFVALGHESVTVYGEAYGGSQQGQSKRYGIALRFVAFEVEVGEAWLSVPNAHDVCNKLGIAFVHYARITTDLAAIDAERDAPSEQAKRNGADGEHAREGVVLRPLIELRDHRGERLMAKHKRPEFSETATPREVDPAQAQALHDAEAIALEWVTSTRLEHVRDHLTARGVPFAVESMRDIIAEMTADVLREGAGEVVDSKPARRAIGKRTVELVMKAMHDALTTGDT